MIQTKEFLYFTKSLDETIQFIEKNEKALIGYGIDIVEIGKTKKFIMIDDGKQIVKPGYWFIWRYNRYNKIQGFKNLKA